MTSTRNDLINIIKCYRKYTNYHEYCNRIRDRFGYWGEQLFPLPKYTEESLEDASIRRAKELGPKNILWSGGVDSTFIICSYIKAKVPFTVICDEISINDGNYFYNWMLKNNINIIKFKSTMESYIIKNMVHGDIADLLFSPDEAHHNIINYDLSFYDNMSHLEDRDRLYEQIQEYGKLLKKPTDTNEHIIRLINFGAFYTHAKDAFLFCVHPLNKWDAFYDYKAFTDIAWSQYWERDVIDDKPEMHRFICEVTQDDKMMYSVYRTRTNLEITRKPYTKDNYIEFKT